jgi:hypothetical protein
MSPGEQSEGGDVNIPAAADSNQFKDSIRALTNVINDKMYLINMLLVKYDEKKESFRKLRILVEEEVSKRGGMDHLEKYSNFLIIDLLLNSKMKLKMCIDH